MRTPREKASNAVAAPLWRTGLLFLAILAAPVAAQPTDVPSVVALSADLDVAKAAHLRRVGAWGAANVAVGATLLLLSDRESADGRRAFGMQTAGWGAVNLAIAGIGLATTGDGSAAGLGEALAAESRYADILWLNMGLNAGYVAVGGTLLAVGARAGVSRADAWRGHGLAVMVQGLGLLVLDGLALAGSADRAEALRALVASAALVPAPGGLGVVVGL